MVLYSSVSYNIGHCFNLVNYGHYILEQRKRNIILMEIGYNVC